MRKISCTLARAREARLLRRIAPLLLLGGAAAPLVAQDATPVKPVPGPEATDVVSVDVLVLGPDAKPLEGVEVQILSRYESTDVVRSRRKTGPDGHINPLLSLWPGTTVLTIYVNPTLQTAPSLLNVTEAVSRGQKLERTIQVTPAGQIQGQVLDEQGQPLAGARVNAWYRDRWKVEEAGDTDPDIFTTAHEDGTFLLGGLPQGPFTLEARTDDRVAVRRAGGNVRSGQRLEGVVLLLAPSHDVTGQVLGADGQPLVKAAVLGGKPGRQKRREDSGIESVWYYPSAQRVVRTDKDGLFTLAGVPESERWNLAVKAPGHLPYAGFIQAGQNYVEVHLEAGGGLTGRVVDGADQPLSGAEVRLRGAGKHKKVTAEDGQFRFQGLGQEGSYFLLVHKAGYGALTLGPYTLDDPPDEIEAGLDAGLALAGIVQDAAGKPRSGASVSVEALLDPALQQALQQASVAPAEAEFSLNATTTTEDGRFRLSDLRPGRYRLHVSTADGASQDLECEAGREDLSVVLSGG